MRYSKFGKRRNLYIAGLHFEILKRHTNYNFKFRGEYYSISIPYNLFNKRLYGMHISHDGTPSNARYYRPKREWGIVEPWLDPAYQKALNERGKI